MEPFPKTFETYFRSDPQLNAALVSRPLRHSLCFDFPSAAVHSYRQS